MKKTIFTCFLFFAVSTIAGAQPYQSVLGKNNTSWSIIEEIFDATYTTSVSITGERIIGEHVYKKLSNQAFIREDPVAGKVWHREDDNLPEQLVMDLTLEVGDSFLLSLFHLPNDTMIIVDSVYFINNSKHIRFNYTVMQSSFKEEKLTFIEGVGSNGFFLQTHGISIPYLLCAYKDSIQTHANAFFNGSCYINFGGLNSRNATSIAHHISPNPFNKYATLSFESTRLDNCRLIIYDINGRILRVMENIATGLVIEKSELPSGVYFYLLSSVEGRRATGKLCIE